MAPETHTRVTRLLSPYLDGELTQSEQQLVDLHLESCEECRRTLEEMQQIQAAARGVEIPEPPEERMAAIERSISVQAPRRLGWILLGLSVFTMALWALWEYFRSRAEFGLQELLVGGVVGGFLLLFFSVLRQRLAELPHDRYRRIEK